MKRRTPVFEPLPNGVSIATETNDVFPLSVMVVYNDIVAALRAAQTIDRLGGKFAGQLRHHLLPVAVQQLLDPGCFDHFLFDAAAADMIIVSFNGPGELPSTLKRWIVRCVARKRASDAAIVALFSADDKIDAADSPRCQFLRKVARAAGLDFFAPWPRGKSPAAGQDEDLMLGELPLAI